MAAFTHFTAQRWSRLCDDLGVAAQSCFEQIQKAYNEPQRAYHTPQHIEECLQLFDSIAKQIQDATLVELCIWLHDVIYQPERTDNEMRSATLACDWFASLHTARLAKVQNYILATKRHEPSPHDMDLQALIDIDLAILASDPVRFKQYGRQIRQEYRFVPWLLYIFKRHQFLKHIARRDPLYHHPMLAARLEPQARKNLP